MTGDCAFCGAPDNSHRVLDAMVGRVQAGDSIEATVADFEWLDARELWLLVSAVYSAELGFTRSKPKAERIDKEWREFLAREGDLVPSRLSPDEPEE
jgi:hypothetical protein